MRVLLDTNIVIHREAPSIVNQDIGVLFGWLDRLRLTKCIHPISIVEIEQHRDKRIVETMKRKLDSYYLLKTLAPLDPRIKNIIAENDVNQNDINDSKILNELLCGRVDFIITEDQKIHAKADSVGVSDRVFSIDAFLEKVAIENPKLIDYKVLGVKKEHFGNINIHDSFFDSLKNDYKEFEVWFNRKADDFAYICKTEDRIIAFLYLKPEDIEENYTDIEPVFAPKKRLKIGTLKVGLNPYKLGERFLKIIFDNALSLQVEEIYVTIFPKYSQLIELIKGWGFRKHSVKHTINGDEDVYVRDFIPSINKENPRLTFPYISFDSRFFLTPIYPEYHTELFPDSILRNESPLNFIENEPHRNAIKKVYISRSIEKGLIKGDIIVFYRTGGYHRGVVTTIGIVEKVITEITDESDFIRLCRKRSIFSDEELGKWWNWKPSIHPFIVNFLYVYSFPRRPNLKRLIDLGIIRSVEDAPRGFIRISRDQFQMILEEANVIKSLIVN